MVATVISGSSHGEDSLKAFAIVDGLKVNGCRALLVCCSLCRDELESRPAAAEMWSHIRLGREVVVALNTEVLMPRPGKLPALVLLAESSCCRSCSHSLRHLC